MQAIRLLSGVVRLLFYKGKGDKSTDEGHVFDMTELNDLMRQLPAAGAILISKNGKRFYWQPACPGVSPTEAAAVAHAACWRASAI
jgi:hypothetical protein